MRKPKPKQSTPVDQGVGSRIAMLRAAHGLSQSQLAEALGISFQQVQKYEAGKNRIGAGRLQAIAERLGVSVASFFEETPEQTSDDALDMLLQNDGAIDLLRAYAAIGDEEIRQTILTMVKATLRVANANAGASEVAQSPPAEMASRSPSH